MLIATHMELVEALDLPFDAAEQLVLHVCSQIAPSALTVSESEVHLKVLSAATALESTHQAFKTIHIGDSQWRKLCARRHWTSTQGRSNRVVTCQHSCQH